MWNSSIETSSKGGNYKLFKGELKFENYLDILEDIKDKFTYIYDIPLSFKILWMWFIQAEILQFLNFLAYNSLYAIVDHFDCFPCISLHQYEKL
jgi:hypothetical protein